jgi:hypothetical protein
MIRTGQLAQVANVTRFLEGTTGADGRFQFDGIPRNCNVELVWWGKGVAPGLADQLEQLDDENGLSLEFTVPAPARIVGTVDRVAYPAAAIVFVSRIGPDPDFLNAALASEQSKFEFNDLAPGEYQVSLMAQERVPDQPGANVAGAREDQSRVGCWGDRDCRIPEVIEPIWDSPTPQSRTTRRRRCAA